MGANPWELLSLAPLPAESTCSINVLAEERRRPDMLRRVLLELAEQPTPRRWLEQSRSGQRLSLRFVAGRELEEALRAIARLAESGMLATLDHLGENVTSEAKAAEAAEAAGRSQEAIAARGLPADISVKLTQFGLDLGEETAWRHLARVGERARAQGSQVEVDMEGSAYTEATLRLVKRAHAAQLPVVAVLQAYLRRTAGDLERLRELGMPIRLVKGAYREPPAIAYPTKHEVDENFLKLMRRLLEGPAQAKIATHDERLLAAARARARELKLGADRFEFQMLYGIRRDLQRHFPALAAARILQHHARDFLSRDIADFYDFRVGDPADFWILLRPLQHDERRPELVAPVDQRHALREARQKHRLFHRRVAAAHHDDVAPAEKKAVAGGATGNPVPDQRLFRFQPQPARARAGGDDYRGRFQFALFQFQPVGLAFQPQPLHPPVAKLRSKTLRLPPDVVNQLRPLDPFDKTGKVFD